jgi:hypothetical protein
MCLTTARAQIWNNLGGRSSAPNALAVTDRLVNARDTLDVYAIWDDLSVRVNGQAYSCRNRSGHPICANFFTGWTTLSGLLAAKTPSAVAWGSHREVFVLDLNGQLWHNYAEDTADWSGWQSLGAPAPALCSSPSAVSWAPGRIDVFAQGCDYQLWHIYNDHGWHNWEVTPGSGFMNGIPSAASNGPGRLDVAVPDFSGHVWDASYNNGSWSYQNTNMLGCGTSPTVAPLSTPVVGVLVQCNSQQILGSSFVPTLGSWNSNSTPVLANPYDVFARPALAGNNADFFYLDQNWGISYQVWAYGFWYAANTLGTDNFFTEPVPVNGIGNGLIYVFAAKTDGSIWYTFFDPRFDFSQTAAPSSRSVVAGSSASYTISELPLDGAGSTVSLQVAPSSLPPGAGASFTPVLINGLGSSTLNIMTSTSTPPGAYSLVITGTSGNISHSSAVQFTVSAH